MPLREKALLPLGAKSWSSTSPRRVLTPQETDEIFACCAAWRPTGHPIVFISHKLYEVLAVADRNHRHPARPRDRERSPGETTEESWPNLMVGREVELTVRPRRVARRRGLCFRVEGLTSDGRSPHEVVPGATVRRSEPERSSASRASRATARTS